MPKDYSIGYKFKGDSTGFQREMGRMNSSLNGIKRTLNTTGAAIAAVFSIRAIVNFTKNAIIAYDKQAKAEQSLLVALKGRTDIQQNLIRQASELQKKTLFGDEQTIEAASRMAMVIGTNEDAIKRLMPLVQDLASAKFEGNLVTAADMVAKSIGSSTNALSRYGIEIKGAVGSTGRLESAIEGLNKQVGGQAEAAAKTGLGPLTQLKNAWGDLTEAIGQSILKSEGFKNSISGLSKLVQNLSDRGLLSTLFEKRSTWGARQTEKTKWDIPEEYVPYFGMGTMLGQVNVIGDIKKVDNTIADLVKKIKDGAEQSRQMAEAWKIVHNEIAASHGAAGLTGVSVGLSLPGFGTKPVTPGLRPFGGQVAEVDQMTEVLKNQALVVDTLSMAFSNMFSNMDKGFKAMAQSMIESIKRIAMELAAKAVVFGILKVLFPEMFAAGRLLEGVNLGKFITGSYASGTNYAPGGLSLVGERGPELVNIPRGAQVIPMGGKLKFEFGNARLRGTDIYFSVVQTAEMLNRNT